MRAVKARVWRYTAEAIAERREFAALLRDMKGRAGRTSCRCRARVRDMKGLVEQVEGDEEQAGPFPDQASPVRFLPAILVCGR